METMISLMIAGNNQFMIEMLLEVFELLRYRCCWRCKKQFENIDLAMKLKPHIIYRYY